MSLISLIFPDEVIVSFLAAIVLSGATMLKLLWNRVNKLQVQVAELTLQLELYKTCPVIDCPMHERVANIDFSDFKELRS